MKKRILAFMLATVFVLTLVMNVSAQGVSRDLAGTKVSSISIDKTTAECVSTITDKSNQIKSVKIEQTLEKFSFLWFWNTAGGPWSAQYGKGNAELVTYKRGLDSGTYRVKSVFTVILKDGRSETITVYSNEAKVA